MATNRPRVSYDPPGYGRVPAGSQTKLSGGSAPHRANPGGGAQHVPAVLPPGGMSAKAQKGYTGAQENKGPVGYPSVLNMKKARQNAGARTEGDFQKRGG